MDVFNIGDESITRRIDLKNDLYLETGEYLVFDYGRSEYLGAFEECLELPLKPCESRVVSVRKKTGRPQIISTSRHITQGAAEILSMKWDEAALQLRWSAKLVEKDPYKVYLYVPEGYELCECSKQCQKVLDGIFCITCIPEGKEIFDFSVTFSKWVK